MVETPYRMTQLVEMGRTIDVQPREAEFAGEKCPTTVLGRPAATV
jgi:hypothetical protein